MYKKLVVIVISLSLLISGCNIKKDFIQPMQEHQGIPTNCSVIC